MNMLQIIGRSSIIGLAATALVAASACGGAPAPAKATSAAPTKAAATTASSAATAAATTAAATKAAAPAGTAAAPAAAPKAGGDPLLAQGKELFEKTAGGVGCASCHGMDGKGNGPAGVGAPANRGADENLIREKLGTVELMASVKLTDAEIKAVAAYLKFLATQP